MACLCEYKKDRPLSVQQFFQRVNEGVIRHSSQYKICPFHITIIHLEGLESYRLLTCKGSFARIKKRVAKAKEKLHPYRG